MKNVQVERGTIKMNQKNEKPNKYAGLGTAMAAELMIGFWFGIGVVLAVKMLESLEYCIDEIIKRKSGYCQ